MQLNMTSYLPKRGGPNLSPNPCLRHCLP